AGEVVAVRNVTADVDGFRLSGIAVSEDARSIWLAATAPGSTGVVLRIPAFGAGETTTRLLDHAPAAGLVAEGADIFSTDLTPPSAVGPLFNGQSCRSCHNTPSPGGMGVDADSFVTRVARMSGSTFDPMAGHGGPI